MALTTLKVDTDRAEYSRLEAGRSVVRARVIPTPATGLVNETVVVALTKKGVTLASQPVVFNGDYPKGTVVEFDLTAIKDSDGNTLVNRGKYTVEATDGTFTWKQNISVALITAAEMRKSYCQGLHLISGYKMAAKRQPVLVSGVTISDVSKGTKGGVYALEYDATANTLTWGKGAAIDISGSENEILIDSKGNYVEVDIDQFELPATSQAEGILIAEESLDDDFLRREIEKATQEVEMQLKIFLEPTKIATEPYFSNPKQGEYFDAEAAPLYYKPGDFNIRSRSWQLDLPHHQVSRIDEVTGYIGNTQALTISNGALSVNRKSGTLNVLPYNSQYQYLYMFFAQINFWGIREFIPDFWRYKGTAGIQDDTPSDILKSVGMTAAVAILTTAEQAYRAGTTSESVSKDGVSHSRSYNAKGIYDTTVQEYKEWLKTNLPRIAKHYRGISCVVL